MTGGTDPVFVDTNVLISMDITTAPQHQAALNIVQRYRHSGSELWISRQILREYLANVTRPQKFANPLSAKTATDRVRDFLAWFNIAEDDFQVTIRLLALLEQIPMGWKQVHDANIVATMQVYHIRHLLTHNVKDFSRFAHLITIVPLS